MDSNERPDVSGIYGSLSTGRDLSVGFLTDHNESVHPSDRAPSRKEGKETPAVHCGQHGRGCFGDGEVEQPVERSGKSAAHGSDPRGEQFRSKEVG